MRDQITITLTDVHGSRQFNVSHFLRLLSLWFLLAVTVIVLIGGGILWKLMDERSELESQIEDLYHQRQGIENAYKEELDKQSQLYSALENDKAALENQMTAKEGELSFLQNSLTKIEETIKDSLKIPETLSEKDQKMLESLSQAELDMLMQRIPSGLPTGVRSISDGYGWRTHPVTKRRSFHEGLDIGADMGTKVFSTAQGVVEYVGDSGDGYGLKIIVNHGYSFKTIYAHLSKALVSKGQVVGRRDDLALSGKSGLVSGPHVHYEVHYMGSSLNPRPFADWGMKKFDTVFKQVREVPWESFAELVKQEKHLVLKQSLQMDVLSKEN